MHVSRPMAAASLALPRAAWAWRRSPSSGHASTLAIVLSSALDPSAPSPAGSGGALRSSAPIRPPCPLPRPHHPRHLLPQSSMVTASVPAPPARPPAPPSCSVAPDARSSWRDCRSFHKKRTAWLAFRDACSPCFSMYFTQACRVSAVISSPCHADATRQPFESNPRHSSPQSAQ